MRFKNYLLKGVVFLVILALVPVTGMAKKKKDKKEKLGIK